MDGEKLNLWKERFEIGVKSLQLQFDSFLQDKKLEEYYELKSDGNSENLLFEIKDETLPQIFKDKLTKLFINTIPEDSI